MFSPPWAGRAVHRLPRPCGVSVPPPFFRSASGPAPPGAVICPHRRIALPPFAEPGHEEMVRVRPGIFVRRFGRAGRRRQGRGDLAAAPAVGLRRGHEEGRGEFHGKPGVVLHVGDSITYSNPYGQWARHGEGKTDEDKAALKWMHAGADNDSDGWYLARFDHPDGGRSYTACGGIRIDEMLAGGKNKMPPLTRSLDDLQAAGRRPHARHQRRLGRPQRRRLPGRHGEGRRSDARPGRRLHPVHHPAAPRQAGPGRKLQRGAAKAGEGPRPAADRLRAGDPEAPARTTGTARCSARTTSIRPPTQGGATPHSAPTAENLRNSGYLLRGWLSVEKIAEVKKTVFDGLPRIRGLTPPARRPPRRRPARRSRRR